jgi:hypothetical protein
LDVRKGRTEIGVWCKECFGEMRRYGWWAVRRRRRQARERFIEDVEVSKRAWAEEEFVLHAQGCREVQKIWKAF